MARSLLGRRPQGREDGFSLVELIVAMIIIAVVLLLLIGVQISAAVSVTEARKLQQATASANEAIEQMHSIPWNTLNRGMASNFLSAAGGDDLVVGGNLEVDGESIPLIIAPSGSGDQDLTNPARPLFSGTGSNKQVRTDPSLVGIEFTIKAYVVDPSTADTDGIVRIAVVVEWPSRGDVARTVVWSEAYRGSSTSCGNADTQPFLAACQAFFEASSNSGNVTIGVSARDVPVAPAVETAQPLVTVGSEYSLSTRTADAAATLRSQQVNYVSSVIEFGGNTWDDNDGGTEASTRGYEVHELRATDDVTNQGGWLENPTALSVTQASTVESQLNFLNGGTPKLEFRTRSDWQRTATAVSSMTVSCRAGIPAGEPCSTAKISNNSSSWEPGSGYLLLDVNGQTFRLSRRLSENGGNTDDAWVARFASSNGSVATGCATLSGPGCVAAGASRTNADLYLGTVIGGTWGAGGPSTMATITNYSDSVRVERGASQTTTAPVVDRSGQVNFWNGSAMEVFSFDENTDHIIDTAPVVWTHSTDAYTVTATSQIQIHPSVITNEAPADALCKTETCWVSGSSGAISITSEYLVEWPGGYQQVYVVSTTITAPSAQAAFKAAPSAS